VVSLWRPGARGLGRGSGGEGSRARPAATCGLGYRGRGGLGVKPNARNGRCIARGRGDSPSRAWAPPGVRPRWPPAAAAPGPRAAGRPGPPLRRGTRGRAARWRAGKVGPAGARPAAAPGPDSPGPEALARGPLTTSPTPWLRAAARPPLIMKKQPDYPLEFPAPRREGAARVAHVHTQQAAGACGRPAGARAGAGRAAGAARREEASSAWGGGKAGRGREEGGQGCRKRVSQAVGVGRSGLMLGGGGGRGGRPRGRGARHRADGGQIRTRGKAKERAQVHSLVKNLGPARRARGRAAAACRRGRVKSLP
jgi:hypothetical protein